MAKRKQQVINTQKQKTMEIEKALEYAQTFKEAIVRGDGWGLYASGGIVYKKDTVQLQIGLDFSRQFMKLLLNTFIDVHNSLSKSLEEDEDLKDAYIKYGEPFVHALQKSAEEHSHNFVQQWLDQHRDDENNHLINFGPTNDEPKEHPVKIDPADETTVDDDPEESEEDIPQIVINIGELNINLNGSV